MNRKDGGTALHPIDALKYYDGCLGVSDNGSTVPLISESEPRGCQPALGLYSIEGVLMGTRGGAPERNLITARTIAALLKSSWIEPSRSAY